MSHRPLVSPSLGGGRVLFYPRPMRQRRAAVVGAGPNGLVAAVRLARAGWAVTVYEAQATPGGAARSLRGLLGSDTIVDLGAAAHPFGVVSPALRELGFRDWVHAPLPLAHPLDGRPAALMQPGLGETARGLGRDAGRWEALHRPVVEQVSRHVENLLQPLASWPPHPVDFLRFGLRALWSAQALSTTLFREEPARVLTLGSAAHALCPPSMPLTASFGIVFNAFGMARGWPVARGGTQVIIDHLLDHLHANDGQVLCGQPITAIDQLVDPGGRFDWDAVVLDLAPRGVLGIRGLRLPRRVAASLRNWRYGPGVYKVDFRLSTPVPWTDPAVAGAGTVHVCGEAAEIELAAHQVAAGQLPQRPFVMVCQQAVADPSRGPVLWTYAQVPNGYREAYPGQVAERIEAQIERFAPGFRDSITARRESSPAHLAAQDANLVGGDIAAGAMGGLQMLARPRLTVDPYRLAEGVYLCSAATPPGGGVHGMGGWNCAERILAQARN